MSLLEVIFPQVRAEVLPGQTVVVSARDGEMEFATEVAAAAA